LGVDNIALYGNPYNRGSRNIRSTSLARSLVFASLAITLLALACIGASAYWFVFEPSRQTLVQSGLSTAADSVEEKLRQIVQRTEAVARICREWGREGLIDVEHGRRFVDLMGPVLERGPNILSMVVAREDGREALIMRGVQSRFLTRETDPRRMAGRAIFRTWSQEGGPLTEEIHPSAYDARVRPWFIGARDMPEGQDIFWTEPYTFISSGTPGMSAVMRWTDRSKTRYFSTTDIGLIDLSRFTTQLAVGTNGFAAVLTEDGRVVGLPRNSRFADEAALRDAVLQPVERIGLPMLAAAYLHWKEAGNGAGIVRFSAGGGSWIATFRKIALGNRSLVVASTAPEADFSPLTVTHVSLFFVLVAATLCAAVFLAMRLASRVARPLSELAAESERIGRLELDKPVEVSSPWTEIVSVERAQETMRSRLLAATRDLELTVARRTADLVQARDAADQSARAKSAFLANMSHEIRTPLNAIIGMTQLAIRKGAGAVPLDHLERILESAHSLLEVINDILDVSKIEADKMVLERYPFSLDEVLRRSMQVVLPAADKKQLEVVVERAPGVANDFVGDALRLQQVLVNLLSNAVKFTGGGEIHLRIDRVGNGRASQLLRFAVRDTGIGIEAGRLDVLFKPFSQADDSMARRYGGTGLGLSISRRLVELMGGRIEVESEAGKGSKFTFTVRLELGTEVDTQENRASHYLSGLRALLVDDNATARTVVADCLRGFGLDVDCADSGGAARTLFAAARHSARPYDFVLIDWNMPGEDGIEVASTMRADGEGSERLFLMASPAERSAHEPPAASLRICGLVAKPATASTLLEALTESLDPALAQSRGYAVPQIEQTTQFRGVRVLLVEDNELNRIVARGMLDAHGIDVEAAANAGDALARLSAGEVFDLVFMDIQMPGMDGFEATRAIRNLPSGGDVPIVAMTAHAMAGDRERCLAGGMDDYISKPIVPGALDECLRRWLGRHIVGDAPAATRAPADGGNPAGSLRALKGRLESFFPEEGLARVGGNANRLLALLEKFAAMHGDGPDKLIRAMNEGDLATLQRETHDLAGAAGTVGLIVLSERARQIEHILSADDAPEQITENVERRLLVLHALWERSLKAIRED
jgi:signal transduction histidine kinase/DNA-binding response OmpR family regulator/HPt (histidine-containing phosphotransfer) domain-containing protein